MNSGKDSLWERVDERVLRWVAGLPPAFTSDGALFDLPRFNSTPFEEFEGLDTREVADSLLRLTNADFVGGKCDNAGETWWYLRLGPRGLVYLGEWPDLDLVASAAALHHALRAIADAAPEADRDAVSRAAGVLGRTGDGVLRDVLSELAHGLGEELTT